MTLLETLDHSFRTTCKVVLGKEIGGIEEWGSWLAEYAKKPPARKSHLSNREVYPASRQYPEGARFIHFDEIDFKRRFEPLSINEMKDIDSIIEALGERLCYSGSVVLGNSKEVENSSSITDSFFIYNCNSVWKSKYLAYSSYAKECSNLFGAHDVVSSEYMIRTSCAGGMKGNKRCFESNMISASSDSYYSVYLEGCSDCMFSFYQKGKRNLIGNTPLPKEKYASVKKSLLEQAVDELSSKGQTLRFLDLFEKEKEEICNDAFETFDKAEINEAFNSTAKVLLGKELGEIDQYADWLTNELDFYDLKFVKSAVSGKPVPSTKEYYGFTGELKHMTLEELENASRDGFYREEKNDLHEFAKDVRNRIGYCQIFNQDCKKVDCFILCVKSYDSWRCTMPVFSKHVAYCFWPRESENLFGSSIVFNSSSVIRGMHCSNVTRGFEVDSSSNSSDIYFSHNVENARDSMFCFNAKNLKNAIGNAPLPGDNFAKIKKSLLEQICSELKKKKSLTWSIYDMGHEEIW